MAGVYSAFIFLTVLITTVKPDTDAIPGADALLDIFGDIYQATGTFPDDKDEYTQLSIVNRPANHCLNVLDRKVGNGGRVGVDKCYLTNVESPELFWLRHAGEGYVALATPWNKCLGAGRRPGALLWTGDWCDEDNFKFELKDVSPLGVKLRNKATGQYLTAPDVAKQQAFTSEHMPHDNRQLWAFCDPAGNLCWPPAPISTTTPTPTVQTTAYEKKSFYFGPNVANNSLDYEE